MKTGSVLSSPIRTMEYNLRKALDRLDSLSVLLRDGNEEVKELTQEVEGYREAIKMLYVESNKI